MVRSGAHLAKHVEKLGAQLGDEPLASALEASGRVSPDALRAFAALAEQAVQMGIDYRTLGLGWDHPRSRRQYRNVGHASIAAKASRQRAEFSRQRLKEILAAVAAGEADAETTVVQELLREIGLPLDFEDFAGAAAAAKATFSGAVAALDAELLLPLRALNEGGASLSRTIDGTPLPEDEIRRAVLAITEATLSRADGFSRWRYGNAVGQEQLRGLSARQLALWRDPSEVVFPEARGLRTHEDGPGELGFFWATKIGGPSHGFDFEGQCILPLLANARHKVLLISDPQWPHHPAGRAHLRFLWSLGSRERPLQEPEPRLWLEVVNCDFAAANAGIGAENWGDATLRHAIAKAEAMQVPLSVEASPRDLLRLASGLPSEVGEAREVSERILLRPSNGVVEASDYLSPKHDWEQTSEEVVGPIERTLYVPRSRTEERCAYRVLTGTLFKKPGVDPATGKIIKFSRTVGSIVASTGRQWTGPAGGRWVELDAAFEKPGWLLVEGSGFGTSGPLVQKLEPG